MNNHLVNSASANAGLPSQMLAPSAATKLHIPPLPVETVVRERLVQQIQRGLASKMTFLCAPAGYGKSTLLAHWAHRAGGRPAWYSLEASDNDPARFWQYIVRAVDAVVPGFAERAGAAARLFWPAQYEGALTMLINELLQLERPLVLVLDDFHCLTNEQLLASFVYFIEYLPATVHVLTASRTEPPFPTTRWVSRQWMTRLDMEDLRFTPYEGAEFYRDCMKLELSQEQTGEWVNATEGWITPMKLAALSIRESDSRLAAVRPSDLPEVAGSLERYLLEEILFQQSGEIRRFVMECSVLQRLNASLCQYVTRMEGCQSMLEQLSGKQLFTAVLDERRGWYRFHPLFSEFLHDRLRREGEERISGLLERAGEWCEREGMHEEAVEYYLTGEHFERAIALLKAMTAKRLNVGPVWLSDLLSRFPASLLMKHPFLYFSRVHMFMVDTNYAKAEQMMREAAEQYGDNERLWSEEEKRDFWGSFYYLKMIHTSIVLGDEEQTLHCMRLSRQYSPDGTCLIFAQSGIAGLPTIVQKFIRTGRFIDKQTNLAILDHMSLIAGGTGSSMQTCLAEALYGYNELEKAKNTAEDALHTALHLDPNVIPEMLLAARLVLFRIHRVAGRRREAAELMATTRNELMELGLTASLVYCDAELALTALEEGDGSRAADWIDRYLTNAEFGIGVSQLYEGQYAVRLYAALGMLREAEEWAERLLGVAKQADSLYVWLELSVCRALLMAETGRTDEALALLQEVLRLSEPREYVRLFLDAGEPMAELLALAIRSRDRVRTAELPTIGYLRGLLSAFGRRDEAEDGGTLSYVKLILTSKEYEVLLLVARELTNKEIAAELGIAYGTVRTHLNNIYEKLDVNGREEVVRIGRECAQQSADG